MERSITGFHQDEEGDWIAELACGHSQHVRHNPPFQLQAWVVDTESRRGRIGQLLECPLCDRSEMPERLKFVRSSPEWDSQTMPAGLRRAHRLAEGTWGRIVVRSGRMRFTARSAPPTDTVLIDTVLDESSAQPIPPAVEHEVEPLGQVVFHIDFLEVTR